MELPLLAAGPSGGLPDVQLILYAAVLVLLAGVALLGIGGALYIVAGFGAGPRDSLMVALHQHRWSIAASRCTIELSVLTLGWLLHGPVGFGTVVIALLSGPAVHASFRLLRQAPSARAASGDVPAQRRKSGQRRQHAEAGA